MRINNNISAMNTYSKLSSANSAKSKSLEKLSSGLRINKAGDDAAGLAISEKMRGQISGLNQASSNAQDSISLIQTAEGALSETHSVLQRMRELAVQSSNDTNTADDRSQIKKEVDQLTSELDRISSNTEFNTKKLLNGDSGTKVIYGNNAKVASATSTNDNVVAGTYAINVTTAAERATATGAAFLDAAIATSATQSISVNGKSIEFASVTGDAAATAANFIAAANDAGLGITASGDAASGIDLATNEYGSDQSITITASALTLAMGLTTGAAVDKTDAGVNVAGTIGGTAASGSGRTLLSTTGGSVGVKITLNGAAAGTIAAAGDVQITKNALTTQIGANEGQTMTININAMSSADLGVNSLDLESQGGSADAITVIDDAINLVSTERSKLGAYQNRLDHTINNLTTTSENLAAAESRIRDVDMAQEMMEFTKNNILSQAATSMLAQANQAPQAVLQLLQ